MSTNGKWTPVSYKTVKIKVPNDPGIVNTGSFQAQFGSLIPSGDQPPGIRGRVFVQDMRAGSFILHDRVDNGVAGSGVKYKVNYARKKDGNGGYEIDFTPVSRSQYQQGLIGKYPVPPFGEAAVASALETFTLRYKFEINSKWNSTSLMANFVRLGNEMYDGNGYHDPVTGKIYKQYFRLNYHNQTVYYTVQVFPYHDGSKAVINMVLPTEETAPNTVDFGVIIGNVRKQLETIAQS